MLKHLYKTLLISVISGSLLSFSPAIALAGEAPTQTTTDNNGVITATTKHKFEGISDGDMLASITMVAGGLLTGRMATVYKPPTPDVLIAAAGGVAYIAGEVLTNVKFNGKIKEMMVEVEKKNNGEVNEEQVKRLEDLKKSYEEAKKTTSYKKMLQLGSATAFGAAAVYATYLAITEDSTAVTCRAAMAESAKGLTACAASGATGVSATEAKACVACQEQLVIYGGRYNLYIGSRAIPKFSFISDKEANAHEMFLMDPVNACAGLPGAAVTTVAGAMAQSCAVGSVGIMKINETNAKSLSEKLGTSSNLDFINKMLNVPVVTKVDPTMEKKLTGFANYIEKGLDFLFPKAQASWIPLLGFSASTVAALTLITTGSFPQLDFFMFVPRNRAIVWGLFTGLALLSAKSSDNVIKKLDANIAKIDAILADLNKLAKGVKTQNLSQQGINLSTINPSAVAPISFSTDSTVKTDCMTGNNSTNCASLSNKLSSMPGFSNLPDSFKDIASQSVALGDSLSGAKGITGSTLANAEALGAKQAAVAKLLANRQAVLNKLNPKTTMQKEQDKLQKSMAASIRKSLEKKGMTATGFMASIGSTPIDSSLAKKDITPATGNKLSVGTSPINIQDGAGSDKDASSLKLDFKEQTPGDGLSMGEVSSSGPAKEYDIKSQEINGEFGPSLFELISGRYIKSGYPKLLEEEPSKN
jgi:hypothetical protein